MRRVAVLVKGADELSVLGVRAALRYEEGIHLVDSPGESDLVGVVVGHQLDDRLVAVLRELWAQEVRRTVLVVNELADTDMLTAVELGVCSLVWWQDAGQAKLARIVHQAHRGQAALPPDLLSRFLAQVSRLQRTQEDPRTVGAGLREREVHVLRLVANGLDTREIADELNYSERTIKNVLRDVTNRFQLRNRTHAVAYAMRAGLL
ncbi:helix-turn-helix transcriptional regulator [Lentzea sp. E54]|uniref:helix-turn-helix transcriptional regulator n=1 Tax=Lentzea xerophila TaxID=3435883 RepID=UPI003DA2CEED